MADDLYKLTLLIKISILYADENLMGVKNMFKKKSINKVQVTMLIISAILVMSSRTWAATYYVRPISGEYGAEDGSSYAAAFDGFSDIAWGSLGGGDTLFVAGTFSNQLNVQASGTNDSTRLQIVSCTIANGCGQADPGIIDSVDLGSGWTGGVTVNSYDYITIDGLTITNTTSTNEGHGVRVYNAEYLTIANCTIQYNQADGIYITDADTTNWIVEDSDVSYNEMNGLLIDDGSPQGGIIRRSTFDGNGTSTDASRCADDNTSNSFYHNIYIGWRTQSETEIYENKIINGVCGQGIKIKASGNIHHNYIANNEDYGIMHIEYSGVTATQYAHNNVLVATNNQFAPINYYREGNGNLTIVDYNNSIYFPDGSRGSWAAGFLLDGGAVDSFTAKNNIIYVGDNAFCWMSSSGSVPVSVTIENNWCYKQSGSPIYWNQVVRTWSYWQNTLGFDSPNGGNSDPKYNAPGSNDLTLQSSSPAIDAGENLGASYDDGLDPSSSWPSSVVTLNQGDYGSGWEIGAFIYKSGAGAPPGAPTGLTIIEVP